MATLAKSAKLHTDHHRAGVLDSIDHVRSSTGEAQELVQHACLEDKDIHPRHSLIRFAW